MLPSSMRRSELFPKCGILHIRGSPDQALCTFRERFMTELVDAMCSVQSGKTCPLTPAGRALRADGSKSLSVCSINRFPTGEAEL